MEKKAFPTKLTLFLLVSTLVVFEELIQCRREMGDAQLEQGVEPVAVV